MRCNVSFPNMQIDAPFFSAMKPRFRGGIPENCERFTFQGGGYKAMPPEQGGYFRLRTARQLAGPMAALVDDFVRVVHIIGATQVLKSICGDAWVIYCMEHVLLPMLVLFEDDPKADLYCSMRLMETLRNHPHLAEMLAESRKESRHNVQGTWIKTLHSELLVAGLNDGNVSTLSWPLIWVSEAWQHKSDGLLFKAFKRADRYASSCKILNESQAGLAGEDLHRSTVAAHQVPLTWQCPRCDGEQTWEWRHWAFERPMDFAARPQKKLSVATVGDSLALIEPELPKAGSFGGMKWLDDDGGKRSIEERARSAYWECIWCGHRIEDNDTNRLELCETYRQDYQVQGADGVKISPSQVCFTLPFEAAYNNRFEKTVANYLAAKNAKAHGNETPMQDWFMAERAIFYDPRLTQSRVSIITGGSSGAKSIPDEVVRVMGVDCQQGEIPLKTGHFWYVARAADKKGDLHQIARGYATSWEQIIQIKKALNIPNDNVAFDGGNYLDEILTMAAANFEIVEKDILNPRTGKPTGRKMKVRSVWKVLRGNGVKKSFAHGGQHERRFRSFAMPSFYQRQIALPNGQSAVLNIPVYEWSNLSVKDHLHNLMLGGPTFPKFMALTHDQLDEQSQAKENGDLTYDKQMSNEYRTRVGTRDQWVESTKNVHYRDCECECLVLLDMGGYLGLPALEANE